MAEQEVHESQAQNMSKGMIGEKVSKIHDSQPNTKGALNMPSKKPTSRPRSQIPNHIIIKKPRRLPRRLHRLRTAKNRHHPPLPLPQHRPPIPIQPRNPHPMRTSQQREPLPRIHRISMPRPRKVQRAFILLLDALDHLDDLLRDVRGDVVVEDVAEGAGFVVVGGAGGGGGVRPDGPDDVGPAVHGGDGGFEGVAFEGVLFAAEVEVGVVFGAEGVGGDDGSGRVVHGGDISGFVFAGLWLLKKQHVVSEGAALVCYPSTFLAMTSDLSPRYALHHADTQLQLKYILC